MVDRKEIKDKKMIFFSLGGGMKFANYGTFSFLAAHDQTFQKITMEVIKF